MGKSKSSAAILPYRFSSGRLEVFLVHPGGPFWAKKDSARGRFRRASSRRVRIRSRPRSGSSPRRPVSIDGEFSPLPPLQQPSGKTVVAWAVEGDCDPEQVRSNTFEMEWPPRSGKRQAFPEVDRAAWFDIDEARRRLLPGHVPFLDELMALTGS